MGEGRRGFNVSLGTVPSYADNTNDGLLLDGVRDDSPAAKAGMKAGEEYEVIVMRGAEKLTLKIVPEARK